MTQEKHTPLKLHQVHVRRRGEFCGMTAWEALAPARARNQPVQKPFLFTADEAATEVEALVSQGTPDHNIRIVEN